MKIRSILSALRLAATTCALIMTAITARGGAGNALQFDGVNGYVMVTNNASLNAFPLTVTAWFRTTNANYAIQNIAAKYLDSSANGWFLMVQNGVLRGYYSRTNALAMDISTTNIVADGFWHHAAMTVDASGGKLYLDGVAIGTNFWGGTAAAPTSTEPLYIGRYSNTTNRFQGTLDEVTLWNRSLGIREINYLQHRQLNSNEDGLLALWHLDEGSGTKAGDATGHGFIGALVNNPAWVPSTAPVLFNQVAVDALKFAGTGDFVTVPIDPNLNAFPLTLMAWVRTSYSNATGGAIFNKYVDNSRNGYSMFVENGHLHAWYFKDASDYVWDGVGLGLDGGLISDGQWHHLALVVDAAGGRLYVDGTQTATTNWTGSAGPCTTTNQLVIGKYFSFSTSLPGLIDEPSIWNVALTPTQLNAFMNVPRTGSETGLLGAWGFNDGLGTTATDISPFGRNATLVNGPAWTGSTAFLGDGTSVIHTMLGAVQWTRKFVVNTIAADTSFAATTPCWVRRLDDFGAAGGNTSVQVSLPYSLLSSNLNAPVPLLVNSNQFTVSLPPYLAAAPQANAGGSIQTPSAGMQPQGGTQLASANDRFIFSVAENYSVNSAPSLAADSATLAAAQLLQFDGNLFFGPTLTTFSAIVNTPTPGNPDNGGVDTVLGVLTGVIPASPSHVYGSGLPLNVVLKDNGDAFLIGTQAVNLIATQPDIDCVQNICFVRTNLVMGSNGVTAGIYLKFPTGFSTTYSSHSRITDPAVYLSFSGTPLDASLHPATNMVFLASFYDAPTMFGVVETQPFWMQMNSFTWNVNAGQITLQPTGILFIRQLEDDVLTANGATLSDPNTANRVSNDAYFRNAGIGATQAVITADANGAAQLTTSVSLNPPELRPHFPYAGITPGNQIPTTSGGQISFVNGTVDLANSSLPVSGPVPVSYSTDCTDTNCSGAAGGAIKLQFTPAGNAPLSFTPDGGLLAYGTVPDTSLTWGFNGGGHYGQTAGDVQTGVFEMAGTFLRADQSTQSGGQRAAVILFTGFGDATNASYMERLGQTNYPAGFANYPGLNFRAPPFGRSFVAGQDSGQYALLSNSKYYVRSGGVSGIHQAAPFGSPLNLSLYGYPFTFTSYAVSYLDSENYDSRTDGALVLPVPAGFTQEFTRMKFLCSGGLDSAQLPSTSVVKHMVYWNADITPQSIQFAPQTNAACSTAQRFLVLGVETRLPFIPQAFHATLGFKTNGNLVTAADSVQGVNSRFAVPGHLNLQGSGTSLYPLAAASDGYFNNWENSQRPALGFFTFAGKLRTPFFGEIKVQVLVTPSPGGTNPIVSLAGGWPAPDGNGQDRGWSVNSSNFFNSTGFDPQQFGYPLATGAVSNYTDSPTQQYHARAQKNWLDVAQFDYPLAWDPVLRQFKGFAPGQVDLLVLQLDSNLKHLSAGNIDFDFSQDLSVQFPQLKTLDIANDALNEFNGPLSSLSNALRQVFGQALDTSGLTSGFQSLQKTLNEDAGGFFRPILQPALQGAVNDLYTQLNLSAAAHPGNPQAFLASIPGIVNQLTNEIGGAIANINGTANQANSVVGQINSTLNDVDDTLGLFNRILQKDNTGKRQVVSIVIQKVVQDQGPALGFAANLVGGVGDDALNDVLADADPTFTEIQSELSQLQSQFDQLKQQVTNGTGDFSSSLNAITAQGDQVNTFLKQVATDISNAMAEVTTPQLDYFSSNPDVAKKALSDSLITTFLGSTLPGNYKNTFRGFLSDNNFLLDQLMDVTMDQIDGAIRQDLENEIDGAEDGNFSAFKGLGLLSKSLFSAKIRGSPTFNGDSLRKIHLDTSIKLMMPDEMKFDGYVEVNELDSQSSELGCVPPGAPSAEVTLGVKHVPLQWKGVNDSGGGSPLFLDADARWTLQNGSVLGVGGTLEITGEANFEGCGLHDVGASFAIGELECYLAAKASATVDIGPIPVDFEAGFFAGRACSLDPLIFVDPDVTNALPNATNFTGIYIQYGGSVSLSKAILGEADCALDVEANIATQQYFNGGPDSVTIGYRQKQGLDVSLLCCLSGSAEFTMSASGTVGPGGPELDLLGSADFCGNLGPCPACLKGCKTFTVTGSLNPHGVDYHFSY